MSGPLRDSTLALPTGDIPIGRDPANLLAISDAALSRRHCILSPDGTGYIVRDLESRNGTYVNGVPVKEGPIKHGDQLSIGDSVFILLLEEEAKRAAPAGVEFEDSPAQATAQFRPQDVLYLRPDRILNEFPAASSLIRNLNALLRTSRVVHQIRDLEQLQSQILELIFEVTPAERGAILLDGKGEKFASIFGRQRGATSSQPIRVSRTIARKALEEGFAVLGTDVMSSEGLNRVESLVGANIRSLLCVPLTVFEKTTGCIYLDTSNTASRLDEEHLQLVAAIAGISAVALENARHWHWLEQENLRLATEINLEHNMVGESACLKNMYRLLSRVAPTDSTVLIEGESGTGKEMAARAIHRNSPRSNKPFVAINCAAIPEGLLESELFGHERGSFTGAIAQKKGKLEAANGGVVFLDEIGELSSSLQAKLLRVVQEREIERVGGTRPIFVDIRVIAATNKNLAAAVEAGEFRRDLYYRLKVVALVMPALRERREDIPLLAGHFVEKYSKKCAIRPKNISPEAMACLMNYDWPGNVRELENAIESALVLSPSEIIRVEDLPEALVDKGLPSGISGARYHVAVRDVKKQLIVKAMSEANGSYTEAAGTLGVHVNYLHRLIRNLNLREELKSLPGSRGNGRGSKN